MTRRASRLAVALLALLGLCVPALSAAAGCTLEKFAEMPVTMTGAKPVVSVEINGRQTPLIADSGSFFSILTPASAAELDLRLYPAPFNLTVAGIGGDASIRLTTVRRFEFSGITVPNVQFVVGGSEPGAGTAGVLGQNVLGIADAEYDLGDGVIRLIRPRNCGRAALAYWAASPSSAPVSVLSIEPTSPGAPWTIGTARLNGAPIRVLFDTGATVSLLTLRAAARAGVHPTDPGVVPAGLTHGVGRGTIGTWIAPFQSFQIGDEQILHTRLRIGDVKLNGVDMLLGVDFFLSHRIYVSNSQHRLYFTYDGGPVFDLGAAPAAAPPPQPGQPADAAGFARRGAAFAARREFAQAIADLSRACELSPDDPSYFYQRALVYRDQGQRALAMSDLDRALGLQSDDVEALVARAQLHLAGRDDAAARADLDAAASHASPQADVRLAIADAYQRANLPVLAISQYGLWITAHSQDARMPGALNGRCRARALAGRELNEALADCNAALKMAPGVPQFLDSRALVRLRLGRFDQSIADYDAALRRTPRSAWSLYGRGVDELRKGMQPEGRHDIAAAVALSPTIAEQARGYGITRMDSAPPAPPAAQ